MACATLKRSLEFDPVHSHVRPSKRRRCAPMCGSPSPSTSQALGARKTQSPFSDVHQKLTPEKMAANLREEIRRLHKRKQLFNQGDEVEGPSSPSTPSCSTIFSNSTTSPSSKEKPLFTFRQVGLICERMLREQESKIREEYDQILNLKLAEQYDAFVKFTYDQIQKRFESSAVPSYLS
ncbi:akirin-2 [Trichogramma pretiosum]|uniref:akirin-2 n=1 Tax=Trichogramma pretiosum TaxID=7493 RepID=UPI0006C9501E|nr:akirin-2 [Trichogramma pretiosum]